MCICIATTAHPDYPLILLSNRDEWFERPTAKAEYWQDNLNILAPCDLSKKEHGTWIGVSKQGKLAVLLNFHEQQSTGYQISRGAFPKMFLSSDLNNDEWIKREKEIHGDKLQLAGGFTMICGDLNYCHNVKLFSNRGGDQVDLFDKNTKTVCLSNSHYKEPWPKAVLGVGLLDKAIGNCVENNINEDEMVNELIKVLKNDTFPRTSQTIENLRQSIFIPPVELMGKTYGTRTCTIILLKKDMNVKYIEHTIVDDTTNEYSFKI